MTQNRRPAALERGEAGKCVLCHERLSPTAISVSSQRLRTRWIKRRTRFSEDVCHLIAGLAFDTTETRS
jgi:hypothetical protein